MNFCEYGCGKEARYQFKNGKWCCSGNIGACPQVKEKIRQTSQSKEVQEKKKQTCLKNHGVEYPAQSKEVREKGKQTNLKIRGVENPLQNKEVQEKRNKTCLKKYGVENPSQNKEVQEKIKQTNMERYGSEYPLQSKELREKIKQTNLKTIGVEHPFQNKEVQEKIKQTNMEKYGVEHHMQSIEIKEKLLDNHAFFCQVEEIKIEANQFKVHCKNSNCQNSKENRGWFTPTTAQLHSRIREIEGEDGTGGSFLYCSENCKTTCLAFNVHGDPERDNQLPHTQEQYETFKLHDPERDNQLPHTQEQYETFKLHVLTRDKYICQYCGAPATDVHHERPVKLEPFFSLDPCYGWACCEKCHYAKGHKKGTECSTGNLAAVVCSPVKKMPPLKN